MRISNDGNSSGLRKIAPAEAPDSLPILFEITVLLISTSGNSSSSPPTVK